MKYNVKSNKNLCEFSSLSFGELFLDEDNVPNIKICDVTNHAYGDIYNSICLSDGSGNNFRGDDMVFVPDYELKIFIPN